MFTASVNFYNHEFSNAKFLGYTDIISVWNYVKTVSAALLELGFEETAIYPSQYFNAFTREILSPNPIFPDDIQIFYMIVLIINNMVKSTTLRILCWKEYGFHSSVKVLSI